MRLVAFCKRLNNNNNGGDDNKSNTTATNNITTSTPNPEPQNNNSSNTEASSPQETFDPRDLKTQCIDPVNRTMISLNELAKYPEGYVFYDDGNEKIIKEGGGLVTKINSMSDEELKEVFDTYDRIMNLVNSNQDCLNWLEQHGGLKSVAESNYGPSVIANDGEIYYLY